MNFDKIEKQLREEKEKTQTPLDSSFAQGVMEEIERRQVTPIPARSYSHPLLRVAALLLVSLGIGYGLLWKDGVQEDSQHDVINQDIVMEELQLLKDDLEEMVDLDNPLLASYFSFGERRLSTEE